MLKTKFLLFLTAISITLSCGKIDDQEQDSSISTNQSKEKEKEIEQKEVDHDCGKKNCGEHKNINDEEYQEPPFGVSVIGVCENSNCKHYEKEMIHNFGYGSFFIKKDGIINEKVMGCPSCKKILSPKERRLSLKFCESLLNCIGKWPTLLYSTNRSDKIGYEELDEEIDQYETISIEVHRVK